MLTNHTSAKSDFRKSCIKRLKFVSNIAKYKKNKNLVKEITKIVYELKPRSVLLYLPMDMEVDMRPLINKLRKEGKTDIYVPVVKDDSFIAVKYRLPLKRNSFGIKEPKISAFRQKIDLAVVPIVGIDSDYKRIGFGKGMYDRFFDRLGYSPVTIFTQLVLCKSNRHLTDKYDIQADYIIAG